MRTLVHLTANGDANNGIVQRYAELHGCRYVFCDYKADMFRNADKIKLASFVVIWNGKQWTGSLGAELCRARKIPHCFIEQGMLKQKEQYFVDPYGFVGDSVLAKDVSWVTASDMSALSLAREKLQQQYPMTDEGFVLAPLQVCSDSQVLYYSNFNSMGHFIHHLEEMYPHSPIIARPHPKGAQSRKFRRAINLKEGDFLQQAARCSLVAGITSTCLYEAAILGKPVVAFGDHPLRSQHGEHREKILAGALALRVDRQTGDLNAVLARFNIKPNS